MCEMLAEEIEVLEAKIAELVHERDSLREMIEKWEETHNHKITKLETELKRINKLSVERCNKNLEHLTIRKSCAAELQAWNSSGALDHIIIELRGKE